MKSQKFTSASTSINSIKLPRIYSVIVPEIPTGSTILDYGCGRYTDHLRACAESHGLTWAGYDPYNLPGSVPVSADYVVCSNVLNVIEEDDVIDAIVREAVNLAGTAAVFTIYDGDRSGIGRQTGEDSYQRNERISAYKARIQDLGYNVRSRHGALIVSVSAE